MATAHLSVCQHEALCIKRCGFVVSSHLHLFYPISKLLLTGLSATVSSLLADFADVAPAGYMLWPNRMRGRDQDRWDRRRVS